MEDQNLYGNTLRTLRIIHAALFIGPLLFGLVLVLVVHNPDLEQEPQRTAVVLPAMALTAVIGSVIGYALKRKKVRSIPYIIQEDRKLAEYTTANIILFSALEGPALFAWATYQLTGSPYSIALALLMAIQLLGARPTRKKMRLELGVDGI